MSPLIWHLVYILLVLWHAKYMQEYHAPYNGFLKCLLKKFSIPGWEVSEDIYAWLAILILPLNSALNPILYTLTTIRFKQQVNRKISFCLFIATIRSH